MPIGDMLVLGLIAAAFIAFAGTLAWVSHEPAKPRAKQIAANSPFTARHA